MEFEEAADLPEGQKFSIELIEKDPQKYKKGLATDPEMVKKPNFGIRIKKSRDFTLKDLPEYNKALEKVHNEWLEKNGYTRAKNPEYFINENPNLARFWYFFAGKLKEVLTQNSPEPLIKTQLETFSEVFETIGKSYAPETEVKPATSDGHLEFLWETELKEKISRIISWEGDDYSGNSLKKALNNIVKLGIRNINEKQQTQVRQVEFRHVENEMMRKSDVSEVVKNNWGNMTYILFLLGLTEKQKELAELQKEYRELQQKIENSRDSEETENLKKELSKLQLKVTKNINAIIYSEKFWQGSKDEFSFQDLLNKEVNCMTRGQLIHSMWKEFFGEETLGATTKGHYFSVLRLANGQYASLNGDVEEINDLEKWKKEKVVQVGVHKEFYQSAVLDWQANKKDWTLVEKLYREAIRINPRNPDYKNNLALLLAKQPDRWKEAEKLYLEAIRINPRYPDYKNNLAPLLDKQPDRWKEAEKLYLKAENLDKNNPWRATALANFYDNSFWSQNRRNDDKKKFAKEFTDHKAKALQWYKKAEKIMEADLDKPENERRPNWLSLKEIKQRVSRLEK